MKKLSPQLKKQKKIKLREGDLFEFGLLAQTWLVKKKKGHLVAYIVSLDSGWGYGEDVADIENNAQHKENGFYLFGNIKSYEI